MRRRHVAFLVRLCLNLERMLLGLQCGDLFEVLLDSNLADVSRAQLSEILVFVNVTMSLQGPSWGNELAQFMMLVFFVMVTMVMFVFIY